VWIYVNKQLSNSTIKNRRDTRNTDSFPSPFCFNMNFIRPPDIPVGGLMFYRDSSFSFAMYPPSSLNRTERKSATLSEVSAVWKHISKMWVIPSPYKSGVQNHPFRQLCNLMATLTAYISGTKHDTPIHNRASALTTTLGFLHGVKTTSTWGPQTASNFTAIFTYRVTSINCALYFFARLRRWIPANGTQ